MQKFDYDKIISLDTLSQINESDKNKLITLASIESSKLSPKGLNGIITNNRNLSIKAFFNEGLYKDFKEEHKEIMSIYVIFDSEKFIKILLEMNINFEIVKAIAIKISELKYVKKINPNDSVFESKYISNIISVIDKICFFIEKAFENQDDYAVINKLMCIVAFEEELYLKLQQQKTIKPQKN